MKRELDLFYLLDNFEYNDCEEEDGEQLKERADDDSNTYKINYRKMCIQCGIRFSTKQISDRLCKVCNNKEE